MVMRFKSPKFQSRNRETSIFNEHFAYEASLNALKFQSRNRETSIFNCQLSLPLSTTAGHSFQSRNRETSIFNSISALTIWSLAIVSIS